MKKALTIAKDIVKEKYYNTVLGRSEKKLRNFYNNKSLIESVSIRDLDKIKKIRTEQEKGQMQLEKEYKVEYNLMKKRYANKGDDILQHAMTQELSILEKYNG